LLSADGNRQTGAAIGPVPRRIVRVHEPSFAGSPPDLIAPLAVESSSSLESVGGEAPATESAAPESAPAPEPTPAENSAGGSEGGSFGAPVGGSGE
jgi:hypothetical protein